MTNTHPDTSSQVLAEPSRLPARKQDWANVTDPIVLKYPAKLRINSYPDVFPAHLRNETLASVNEVIEEHRADFDLAAEAIAPQAWRLLYFRGNFCLEALSIYTFCPEGELLRLCRDGFDDPPSSWLGSVDDPASIAADLEINLRYLGSGPCHAVWVVLAVAKRVRLTPAEILTCEWWNPDWIHSLTRHVKMAA